MASAAPARASLPTIERQVMCVTCKIPLDVAESPQADREKAFIEGLIAEGQDEAQIKRALVAQYGPTVLGLPADHGFDLTAYLVPLAVVVGLVALMIVMLSALAPRTAARGPPARRSRPSAPPMRPGWTPTSRTSTRPPGPGRGPRRGGRPLPAGCRRAAGLHLLRRAHAEQPQAACDRPPRGHAEGDPEATRATRSRRRSRGSRGRRR